MRMDDGPNDGVKIKTFLIRLAPPAFWNGQIFSSSHWVSTGEFSATRAFERQIYSCLEWRRTPAAVVRNDSNNLLTTYWLTWPGIFSTNHRFWTTTKEGVSTRQTEVFSQIDTSFISRKTEYFILSMRNL